MMHARLALSRSIPHLCCFTRRGYHQVPRATLRTQYELAPEIGRGSVSFTSNPFRATKQPPAGEEREDHPIDDAEWELRVGHAISILSRTLPEFFKSGLVTRFDAHPSVFRVVEAIHPPPDLIYAKNIRLKYAPPERLPAPFPEVLHIEGLPLYFASAAIVRTSLNTLYHDVHLALKSVKLLERVEWDTRRPSGMCKSNLSSALSFQRCTKLLWLRRFRTSTYKFSQNTGLINQHDVDSIHPAPHNTVYDALRSSLQKLGLLAPEPEPRVNVGCEKN
ncbi:hypothetical protein RhiJN_06466 [Ceratobasidium sp. AG-Ba]|nr:hypothetical protein RhiJN_06466 [Ceratobasidium sp. AG-Ba]QRW07381.1 hypothetical protein RhiLY_06380 [Ceratobasidium sp. AG-Ba]